MGVFCGIWMDKDEAAFRTFEGRKEYGNTEWRVAAAPPSFVAPDAAPCSEFITVRVSQELPRWPFRESRPMTPRFIVSCTKKFRLRICMFKNSSVVTAYP